MFASREACLANQVEKECEKGLTEPACLSLSYKTVKNGKDKGVFMKKCSELKMCQDLCFSGMIRDMENCRVRCLFSCFLRWFLFKLCKIVTITRSFIKFLASLFLVSTTSTFYLDFFCNKCHEGNAYFPHSLYKKKP